MSPILGKEEAVKRALENAPYLAESIALYPPLVEQFLMSDPAKILEVLFAEVPAVIGELNSEMSMLRILKRKCHLVIALSDISGHWSWVEVTECLTQLADFCLQRILVASARVQGLLSSDENPVPGLFILAMGKYGARELNYSSDIDFNVFYDPEKIVMPDPSRAERVLIRLVRSIVKGMEAITVDGYIFRTDLRLRPDPRSNAVAVSTLTAERYYESLGQNWERAAMIKARVCAGDQSVGELFIKNTLSPFIWRRNLNYAAIEDILAIKRQIHSRLGRTTIEIPGHHLKLGAGGIREVEFYAQVQQLILGGRHPELRSLRTVEALAGLSNGGFITENDANALTAHYSVLRKLEHIAQMIDDAQTHIVPEDDDKRMQFSRLAGYENCKDFEKDLEARLLDVHRIYSELFPEAQSLASREGNMVFTGVEADPETLGALTRLGYHDGKSIWRDMAEWLGGRIRATRTERARELLTKLAPIIIEFCSDTGTPDKAFKAFGGFFTQVSGGVALLSMFEKEPERLKYVISLISKSPQIAEAIARTPAILDALSDPEFLEVTEDRLLGGQEQVVAATCFEDAINGARRWVREEHFRLSAALLSKRLMPLEAARFFTILAERTIAVLLPFAVTEVERKHGQLSGSVGVIGLGKLGSYELSLTSDLDIMLVYEAGADEDNAQHIYAKVTQRLINALSAVTEEGTLYEVDMALRPSGRAGPVAVSTEAFKRYYAEKAWTWEFMALSRSRIVASSRVEFFNSLEKLRVSALLSERPDLDFNSDIVDMLERLRREKPARHDWDIKNMQGGLRDVEFIAQKLFLSDRMGFIEKDIPTTRDIISAAGNMKLSKDELMSTLNAYDDYMGMLQIFSACFGGRLEHVDDSELNAITDLLGFKSTKDMQRQLKRHCKKIDRLVQNKIF